MIGTMIEVPRAALNAGPIAASAEFFSFGTNDLTQMTWGFSRDDVEGAFFSRYIELGIFGVSPFETIDRDGVGRLVDIAVREGKAARPDLQLGVCGEHGGDPESVHFFHEVGLDYVSCSPFRVPIARLEAGRARAGRGWLRQQVKGKGDAEVTTKAPRPAGWPNHPSGPGAVTSSETGPACCTAPGCAGCRPRPRSSRPGRPTSRGPGSPIRWNARRSAASSARKSAATRIWWTPPAWRTTSATARSATTARPPSTSWPPRTAGSRATPSRCAC